MPLPDKIDSDEYLAVACIAWNGLPRQRRRVLRALSGIKTPAKTKDIAAKARLKINVVAAIMCRLEKTGWTESGRITKRVKQHAFAPDLWYFAKWIKEESPK